MVCYCLFTILTKRECIAEGRGNSGINLVHKFNTVLLLSNYSLGPLTTKKIAKRSEVQQIPQRACREVKGFAKLL